MVFPWKVVGYEKFLTERGDVRFRLYVERKCNPQEPVEGEGLEVGRLYYNPEYVKYSPVVGQKIIATEGRYGIQDIVVLDDSSSGV